ncbi:MAG: hypothetical protein JXB14_02280 [Candidatus Altiarchaeota archaeon]|nr:hypothetical protein [Candidatus Altiarchaeota archaeon]
MATKKFSNQSFEQVISHLRTHLPQDRSYNLKIDPFTYYAGINASTGSKKDSAKREKIRNEAQRLSQRKRRLALSAKRRDKPKLKHVRNGREIKLKGRIGMQSPRS